MVEIYKETSPTKDLAYGHISVSTTAIQICSITMSKRGVLLRCPGPNDPVPNTRPIWIGRMQVTADSTVTGGIPILPGSTLVIPCDDPSQLYAISTLGGQDLAWMGL